MIVFFGEYCGYFPQITPRGLTWKRRGEISQIKMFKQTLKKQASQTTWTLNLLYELKMNLSRINML